MSPLDTKTVRVSLIVIKIRRSNGSPAAGPSWWRASRTITSRGSSAWLTGEAKAEAKAVGAKVGEAKVEEATAVEAKVGTARTQVLAHLTICIQSKI